MHNKLVIGDTDPNSGDLLLSVSEDSQEWLSAGMFTGLSKEQADAAQEHGWAVIGMDAERGFIVQKPYNPHTAIKISKAEFIRRYGIDDALKTDDGYVDGEHTYVALPCKCDYETCEGWAMILDDRKKNRGFSVFLLHCRQNGLDDNGRCKPSSVQDTKGP